MSVTGRHEVRALYDDTAENYDRIRDDEIKSPLYSDVLGGLAKRIRSLEGAVVDTSCGSGTQSAHVGPNSRSIQGRAQTASKTKPKGVGAEAQRCAQDL